MATVPLTPVNQQGEHRFFLIMAWAMAITIVAGFGLNAALGRSSFLVPPIYHVHAFVFFGWVALYVAQNTLVFSGNLALHRRLGWLSVLWLPLVLILGVVITVTSIRRTGGPSFFSVDEFLFVNLAHILCVVLLAGWALHMRRRTDWHRRLMFSSMAVLAAPGVARLLPIPLFVPYAFPALFAASLLFPVLGMLADRKRLGHVHPAWWWGCALPLLALLIGEAFAATDWAEAVTLDVIAGTPGAERPFGPYMP